MLTYDWLGNIRELENFIESAVNFDGNIEFLMSKFQASNIEIKKRKTIKIILYLMI
ncbi:hypothetical protein PL321_08700 [Caloramator sp. mosi_1]|nr:hypothetical protein [Caloramator sp. mosi_1]WDC85398.1 hypothetical protein PL321_08700 [Caloramator sp. mosi_1]